MTSDPVGDRVQLLKLSLGGQAGDHLDVVCLREHIKSVDRVKQIVVSDKLFQIAGQGRRIARNIRHAAWAHCEYSGDHRILATYARRIEQ